MGKSDMVYETEKPTIEVIDQSTGQRFSGQTLKQVADYVAKRTGRKFKSGAEIKRILERAGKAELIADVKRPVSTDYIPSDRLAEVYSIINAMDRQRLLGEIPCE